MKVLKYTAVVHHLLVLICHFHLICGKFTAHSKNNNIRDLYRGINEFKKGFQLRSNLVKDANGDLLSDSHSLLSRWKNYVLPVIECTEGQ
jgi:hypothetical protein